MVMRDQAAVEVAGEVRDVRLVTGDVGRPCSCDRRRLAAEHVVHDREVVHRQVPQHVHIFLEESEVDAH